MHGGGRKERREGREEGGEARGDRNYVSTWPGCEVLDISARPLWDETNV